jgi:hypothetical protein
MEVINDMIYIGILMTGDIDICHYILDNLDKEMPILEFENINPLWQRDMDISMERYVSFIIEPMDRVSISNICEYMIIVGNIGEIYIDPKHREVFYASNIVDLSNILDTLTSSL